MSGQRCIIDGCSNVAKARGWCSTHYTRWNRYGDPHFTKKLVGPPESRFWCKVDRGVDDECWVWTAYVNEWGYGKFRVAPNRLMSAHRFSFELANGPIPEGAVICHHCDNPPCVNPRHLYAGSHLTNRHDWAERNGGNLARGERNGSAVLTGELVRELRRRAMSGEPQTTLAREFNVHPNTIAKAVSGETWGHIPGAVA